MARQCIYMGLVVLVSILGCSKQTPQPAEAEKKAEETETPPPAAEPAAAAEEEMAAKTKKEEKMIPADSPLLDPAKADAKAPDKYSVKLETTEGDIVIDVQREWAPLGADRFYNLVKIGHFDDVAFFRVISGFMAQVGLHGDPRVNDAWSTHRIADDPVKQSNTEGMVSFATSGPDSRTTQFFINFGDNSRLDGMGFSPFGKVRDMKPVNALYSGYGEGAPRGRGPMQGRIRSEGNAYLRAEFPELDYITRATIVE